MNINAVKNDKKTSSTTKLKKTNNKTTNKKVDIKFSSKPSAPQKEKETPVISDATKAIIDDITKKLGLKFYSKELVKDSRDMIIKSKNHLLGLIKYYEGDPANYYEAKLETYNDKYNKKTKGFGCTNKLVSIKTQEQAYQQLEKDLTNAAEYAKNKINNRLGKGTFEKLPLSIQEGLIDLSFNKGPDKVVRQEILNGIKNKDYSAIVANLAYTHSGEKKNGTEEDPGLYRRSLSRAILSARDLTGKEKSEADKEIDKLYKKAKTCFEKKNEPTSTLDDIYTYYKTGKFTENVSENKTAPAESKPAAKTENPEKLTSGTYKFRVDSTFKGKGSFAVARANYEAQDTNKMSFSDFYAIFKQLNSPEALDNVKVGDLMTIPQISGGKKVVQTQVEEKKKETAPISEAQETEKPGFIKRALRKIGAFFSSCWNGIKNFFGANKPEETEEPFEYDSNATPFENLLRMKNKTITEDSHTIETPDGKKIEYTMQTISVVHEVKPKETVWGISHRYGLDRKEMCDYNNIEDENYIKIGQKININRLGYKIKKGDTLYSISKRFGLTPDVLMQLNGIDEGEITDLKEGKFLELPGFIYRVKKGDTFDEIARKVGVDVNILMNINNRQKDILLEGEEIKVIFNNSDYDKAPDAVKSDIVNGKKVEKIDMASSDKPVKSRKYLRYKTKIDGLVVANREEFAPKGNGKLSGKTIIINAGHGYGQASRDPGAVVEKDGLNQEWILNYDNAMRIIPKLQAQGARVIYLQGHRNLIQKALKEPQNKADLFISLHCNAGNGKEIPQERTQFYYRDNVESGKAKSASIEFAKLAESKFDKNYNSKSYAEISTNDERTGVLKTPINTQKIPGIIWEVAFMDNPTGRKRLKSNTIMNNYMDLMTSTVVEFFEKRNNQFKLTRKPD